MFNKRIIMISILIVIFSISYVSAADDSSADIIANDLSEESISLDETIELEESVGDNYNPPLGSSELKKMKFYRKMKTRPMQHLRIWHLK